MKIVAVQVNFHHKPQEILAPNGGKSVGVFSDISDVFIMVEGGLSFEITPNSIGEFIARRAVKITEN